MNSSSGKRNRFDSSSDDENASYKKESGFRGRDGYGLSHSRSFSIDRRNDYNFRGKGFRNDRNRRRRESPPPAPRTEPVVGVKLDIDFEPTSTPEEQKQFLEDWPEEAKKLQAQETEKTQSITYAEAAEQEALAALAVSDEPDPVKVNWNC